LAWPLGLACPSFCYQQLVCSNCSYVTHSSPPTTITQVLTLLHMLGIMGTWHNMQYICRLQSFFLFSFSTSKQVSWPGTLMLGTASVLDTSEKLFPSSPISAVYTVLEFFTSINDAAESSSPLSMTLPNQTLPVSKTQVMSWHC
jgi:hypothetical protein